MANSESYRCCPMCGATHGDSEPSHYSGQDAIKRIAWMILKDPPIVYIMLHKLSGMDVDPVSGERYTLDQIGKRIGRLFRGMTRAAVSQRCNNLCDEMPQLRYLLTEPNKQEAKRRSWQIKRAI